MKITEKFAKMITESTKYLIALKSQDTKKLGGAVLDLRSYVATGLKNPMHSLNKARMNRLGREKFE